MEVCTLSAIGINFCTFVDPMGGQQDALCSWSIEIMNVIQLIRGKEYLDKSHKIVLSHY